MADPSPVDVQLRPRIGPAPSKLRPRTAVGSDVYVYFDVVDRLTGALVPGATGLAGLYWLPTSPAGASAGQPVLVEEAEPGILRMLVPGEVPGPYTAQCYIQTPSRQGAVIAWDVAGDGSAIVTGTANIPWNDLLSAAGAAGAAAANWAFQNLDPRVAEAARRIAALEALTSYVPPTISLSASPSVVEVGFSAGSVMLTVTRNRTDLPVQISGASTATIPAGQSSVTVTGPWTADTYWTASVTDPDAPPDTEPSASASAGLVFRLRSYRGVSAVQAPGEATILALPDQPLAAAYAARANVYDCTGGRYPVLVFPKAWGDPPTQILLNGFASNAFTVSSINLTNAQGASVPCWLLALSTIQNGSNIQVEW